MEKTTEPSTTIWTDGFKIQELSPLTQDASFDVCIIGGGIAGLTTAYLLSREGKKVCVLEGLGLGEGQTGFSTGHVTWLLDRRYYEVIENHGVDGARKVLQSHLSAVGKIKSIVSTEKIDCDLKEAVGYLCSNSEAWQRGELEREEVVLQKLGLTSMHRLEQGPFGFSGGPCLAFPHQLQFHPLKYLDGLAKAIVRDGGAIFTHTHVSKIETKKHLHIITDKGHVIDATSIVVATNTPINNVFTIHTKQSPYRSYVLAFKIPKGRLRASLLWDMEKPYHYVRMHPWTDEYDLLIVGGEDHKTGQNDQPEVCFDRLIQWTKKRFDFAENLARNIVHQWSGQVMEPVDGLPYLGHNPMDDRQVYVITGHSGVGLAQSTLGAMIITDQILGIENPWVSVYNPSRFMVASIPQFLKENANVAAQYAEWLIPHGIDSLEDLERGEGMVINQGLKKVALYRSPDGGLEAYTAACPHLGGVVHWNSVEKSWDCPCHGSRFDCHGKVVEGPALTDLQAVAEPLIPLHAPVREQLAEPPPRLADLGMVPPI